MKRVAAWIFFLTVFTSCYKDHLYVQQEWVDRDFLASSKVGTPDPRQECPPVGQRLLVSWRFPSNLFYQELRLIATVRFWDNSEEVICYPVEKMWGSTAFNFFEKRKILTYRIQVLDRNDEVMEVWEHHFWTELIDMDRRRVSVSSQPKQGSVMEMP